MSSSQVSVQAERERVERGDAPIYSPTFIPDYKVAYANPHEWNNVILRNISMLLFVINSLIDTEFFQAFLQRQELPNLWRAITSVSFPNFFQFAGIRDNRMSNPYIDAVKPNRLPSLGRLTLGFHTAGLTTSVMHERDRIALENQGLMEESKELRVKTLQEVVDHYKLDDLFELQGLSVLNLTCIDSQLVNHFVAAKNELSVFNAMKNYFEGGFYRRGQRVTVNLSVTQVAYT